MLLSQNYFAVARLLIIFFSFPYGSHLFSSRCTDSSDVSAMCALCFVHRAPKNICFLTGYADSKLANGKRLCVHFLGLSIFFMFTWKMYCLLQAVRQQPWTPHTTQFLHTKGSERMKVVKRVPCECPMYILYSTNQHISASETLPHTRCLIKWEFGGHLENREIENIWYCSVGW